MWLREVPCRLLRSAAACYVGDIERPRTKWNYPAEAPWRALMPQVRLRGSVVCAEPEEIRSVWRLSLNCLFINCVCIAVALIISVWSAAQSNVIKRLLQIASTGKSSLSSLKFRECSRIDRINPVDFAWSWTEFLYCSFLFLFSGGWSKEKKAFSVGFGRRKDDKETEPIFSFIQKFM